MVTQSINQSDNELVALSAVDIDSYFDALDFDVDDVDDVDDLELTNNLVRASYAENSFQLPVPIYESTHSPIKQPLDQLSLEQAAYEIRLLARQLDNSPFVVASQRNLYAGKRRLHRRSFNPIRYIPAVALGFLLTSLPFYVRYSQCATAVSCFQHAKRQVLALSSIRLPTIDLSSFSIVRTIAPSQAIAPLSESSSPVPSASSSSSSSLTEASHPTSSPTNPFREAVNQATQAAELTQTAMGADEWEKVVNSWLEAIRLMNMTPATNPRYSVATLKVEEYAKNLAYAQSRLRAAMSITEGQGAASSR